MIDQDIERFRSYGWSNKVIADLIRTKYGIDCREHIRWKTTTSRSGKS